MLNSLTFEEKKRLRANLKALNREYSIAKKQDLENLTFFKDNREKLAQISGSKPKSNLRFANLGEPTPLLERQYLNITDKMLKSKWLTEAGRNEIYEKSEKTFLSRYIAIDKVGRLTAIDVFENENFMKLKEAKKLDSDQIVKAVIKGHNDDVIKSIIDRGMTELGETTSREKWFEYFENALSSLE